MSIPINALVYAGEWDVATRYPQYWFVVSPIDNKAYVNVNVQPIEGGSDPSVPPSDYWVLLNQSSSPTFPPAYASFSSSQTQNLTQALPIVPVFNTADITNVGITASLPTSNLTIVNAGVYKISTIIQFLAAAQSPPVVSEVVMYPVLSSVPVVNSTSNIIINSGDQSSLMVEWLLTVAANSVLSFVCLATGVDTMLIATSLSNPIPNVPSIRTTIVRIA